MINMLASRHSDHFALRMRMKFRRRFRVIGVSFILKGFFIRLLIIEVDPWIDDHITKIRDKVSDQSHYRG